MDGSTTNSFIKRGESDKEEHEHLLREEKIDK
jgi:hypothetical protein